jgi:hypothetical protein
MKKNSLTTAVVAGIAGVAGLASVSNAVNLNPDGLGQVLIYPYYTVNAGNSTLLSVVNTTDEVKAVKVRFLEALNSREVLDFNLYLSPFDVWTAAVIPTDATNGAARLVTADRSCTTPIITATNATFRNNFYTGTQDDDGPNDLARTREGHIEMIEMGVVVDDGDTLGTPFPLALDPANLTGVDETSGDPGDNVGDTFASDATHIDGVPDDCQSLVDSWASGTWNNNRFQDIDEPTGGLFGAGSIVDVANGTNLSYNADAIDGFYTLPASTFQPTLHTSPGSILPSLSQAQTSLTDADSIIFNNGALITLDFLTGRPDAVSSVYMHDQIFNEFNTSPTTLAESEWVVTFPTKRLHLEQTSIARRRPFFNDADDVGDTTGTPAGNIGGAGETLVFDPSGYCEPIDVAYFDREEGPEAPAAVIDFSPPPEVDQVALSLCFEANVVTFNQEAEVTAGSSAVLGSRRVARNINLRTASGTEVTAGWVAMGLGNANNYLLDGTDLTGTVPRNQLFGLPVTGFWVANFVNAQAAPGQLANYSLLSKHRASRFARGVLVTGTADAPVFGAVFAAS